MFDFEGKSVCITGAASGIGRQTAIALAGAGAQVIAADVDGDGLEETAACCMSGTTRSVVADAASDADVTALVAAAQDWVGGLDIFFANAGISGSLQAIDRVGVDEIERVIRVNLIGPILAVKHAGPAIARRGGGAIILTASVAGLKANTGPLVYSATKAGVISIAQSAAQEFAGTGVRVNAVCPGFIETGMTQFAFDRARAKGHGHKLGQLNPARRPGIPQDIAGTVLFLASDAADYVNGHALVVDGGLTSAAPYAPNNVVSIDPP